MRSVQAIQKITKAMKMVAASKLRMDQQRRELGLPFVFPVIHLFARLSSSTIDHTTTGNNDALFLAVSSDKGLCGGVNSSIARLTKSKLAEYVSQGKDVRIYAVGEKVRPPLQRLFSDRFERLLNETMKTPLNFTVAAVIAQRLLQTEASRIMVLYNAFRSVIAYDTMSTELVTLEQATKLRKTEFDAYEFEPEASRMMQDLHEFYVAASVYRCLLENAASEQSARMSAMDNASKNAGEMLSQLTLKYNNARQMKITMELIEIISGANAL